MVALSALSDCSAPVEKYFMINAAVALEAVDGGAIVSTNMVYPGWHSYEARVYASKWFALFPPGDGRNSLTWNNRLANVPVMNLYNFYSNGEEVLREHEGTVPSTFLGIVTEQAINALLGTGGLYAWAWQEKLKGLTASDTFVGSTHGGWQFSLSTNYYSVQWHDDGWVTNRITPAEAANVPDAQLLTNAFFQMTFSHFTADAALYGPNGNDYAATNRNRILSDAIPALTPAIGANPLELLVDIEQNFNMQLRYKNGWPTTRTSPEEQNWHHSDFKDVAYTYIYKLFDEFVDQGNLR